MKLIKFIFISAVIVSIYILIGSPMAKACEFDQDQFEASINKECERIPCVTWDELNKAIEEAR